MRTKFLTRVITLFIMLILVKSPVNAMEAQKLTNEINTLRTTNSLSSLSQEPRLERAAKAKLSDMQQYIYWSHNNPTTGETWWKFVYQAGIRGKVGENLSKGYKEEINVLNAWKKSPSHYANLFNTRFSHIGIAIGEVQYPEGSKTVVVAEFGE